jgi:ubiquinone/menaquinone biosynthesis C-methylase UbiE
MASATRLAAIAQRYDTRAPTYDSEQGFHKKQAAQYIEWMAVQPGFQILDLACGTGAVTIPAARATGPAGSIIGVDISSVSLKIAEEKASKEGVKVDFVLHDIENLEGLEAHGIEEGKFDLITCASAVAVLEHPAEAVTGWAKFLKKGGKLIFDVPSGGTLIKNILLDRVAKELKVEIFNHQITDSIDKVKKLLTDAGLDASETFVTDAYETNTEVLEVGKAGETFDAMLGPGKWGRSWYEELVTPDLYEKSKEGFRKEVEKIADKDGKVVSYLKLNMAIGKKL